MKQVAVSELQEKAAEYLTGSTPLAIELSGRGSGVLLPQEADKAGRTQGDVNYSDILRLPEVEGR